MNHRPGGSIGSSDEAKEVLIAGPAILLLLSYWEDSSSMQPVPCWRGGCGCGVDRGGRRCSNTRGQDVLK
jgi:hypothetical protein